MKRVATALLLTIAIPTAAAEKAPAPLTPAQLRTLAHDYYQWGKREYPVGASDQGDHTFDRRLTDYAPVAIARRRAHVRSLLERLRRTEIAGWSKDDSIDFLLFRSQLERADFPARVLTPEESDPQVYVGEASNAIFSLLKKEYAPPATRARSATARLSAMPAMIEQGKRNLMHPVRLYAQLAIESARAIDPLFNDSLDSIARDLPPAEHDALAAARSAALKSIHDYADWLEKRLPSMTGWKPMGEANYNYILRHILLLPMDARDVAHLGEIELARYRALEAMLPDPSLADPDPQR